MQETQITLSETEQREAVDVEESARVYAENQYLKQRVVQLRAIVNRLQKDAKDREEMNKIPES